MCFTQWADQFQLKIAEEDIVCFKYLNNPMWLPKRLFADAPYRKFRYRVGKLYELGKSLNPMPQYNSCIYIEEGFHSFAEYSEAEYEAKTSTIVSSKVYRRNVYECIIPKGAEYAFSEQEAIYVSDKIIIKKLWK